MSPSDLETIIKRISYKPNWTIQLIVNQTYISDETEFLLRLEACVIDSTDHSKSIQVKLDTVINPFFFSSEEQVKSFILDRIIVLEIHEAKEFFKIDGIHYEDPHPEITAAKPIYLDDLNL